MSLVCHLVCFDFSLKGWLKGKGRRDEGLRGCGRIPLQSENVWLTGENRSKHKQAASQSWGLKVYHPTARVGYVPGHFSEHTEVILGGSHSTVYISIGTWRCGSVKKLLPGRNMALG